MWCSVWLRALVCMRDYLCLGQKWIMGQKLIFLFEREKEMITFLALTSLLCWHFYKKKIRVLWTPLIHCAFPFVIYNKFGGSHESAKCLFMMCVHEIECRKWPNQANGSRNVQFILTWVCVVCTSQKRHMHNWLNNNNNNHNIIVVY